MKKKVIYATIAAMALTAGLYLSQSEKESELSGLLTENVEALAANPAGPDWQGFKTVYGPYRTCCERDAYYKYVVALIRHVKSGIQCARFYIQFRTHSF